MGGGTRCLGLVGDMTIALRSTLLSGLAIPLLVAACASSPDAPRGAGEQTSDADVGDSNPPPAAPDAAVVHQDAGVSGPDDARGSTVGDASGTIPGDAGDTADQGGNDALAPQGTDAGHSGTD